MIKGSGATWIENAEQLATLRVLIEETAEVGERRFWKSRNAWMVKQADGEWERDATQGPPPEGTAVPASKPKRAPLEKKYKPCKGGQIRSTETNRCMQPIVMVREVNDLVKAAVSQKDWKSWYKRNRGIIKELFKEDAELMTKILGATSQAATVQSNIPLAFKAYKQMLRGEPLEGYLEGVQKNLERVRAGDWPEGPKIGPYTKALAGRTDTASVAVDRHIAELLFDTKTPSKPQVRYGKKVIGQIAKQLGWDAPDVQAALWAFNQVRKGKDPAAVESYDTIFTRRREDIEKLIEELKKDVMSEARRPSRKTRAKALKKEIIRILQAQAAAYKKGAKLAKALSARKERESEE